MNIYIYMYVYYAVYTYVLHRKEVAGKNNCWNSETKT